VTWKYSTSIVSRQRYGKSACTFLKLSWTINIIWVCPDTYIVKIPLKTIYNNYFARGYFLSHVNLYFIHLVHYKCCEQCSLEFTDQINRKLQIHSRLNSFKSNSTIRYSDTGFLFAPFYEQFAVTNLHLGFSIACFNC